MTKASDNEFPSLLFKEGSAPASPSAGDQRLFIDSADHLLKYKNSGGTVSDVGGGGTPSFVGCFAYNSTTQSFSDGALTYMALNAEAWDTSSFHDNSTNNSRLVAPVTGYYRLSGGIWYATTTGTNYILYDKNHAGVYIRGGATAWNGGSSGVFLSTTVYLAATEYIEMVGYHTQTGSIVTGDTGTTPSQQNWLAMELLGV
jgi:hypothetical protein